MNIANQYNTRETVGILLAAGQGRRFGGDKCLALLPDGAPMGLRAAQNLSAAVDTLVCVVRPDDWALITLFNNHGFRTVDCPDAALGMSASLKAGIIATPEAQGWVIALADMPLIQPATHQLLVNELREQGGIVRPTYADKAGHPVLFAQQYRDDLLALSGDSGAKAVLKRYQSQLRLLAVDDAGVLQDFDTKDSLLEI
ncbi:nucleotidyltransferase family protein [Leucothrix arctica]|uniref:Nucleotidyltransferase family protein n=2 Tax=Leucothrix arctica TaxID=1481894 RepID=A0A317CCB6_9GAMM|nr:nucleotidyltransferase family protein [Leucothrix arctica]